MAGHDDTHPYYNRIPPAISKDFNLFLRIGKDCDKISRKCFDNITIAFDNKELHAELNIAKYVLEYELLGSVYCCIGVSKLNCVYWKIAID